MRIEQIYIFTAIKAEDEGWDPVKIALAPYPTPTTPAQSFVTDRSKAVL